MPAGPRSPKFKMPAVYRPKKENVFRCKIGFVNTPSGARVRREFRLGDDELAANKKAFALAEAWYREELRHEKSLQVFKEVFPDDPPTLPVWTGMPEVEARFREDYLATPPDDLPGDEHEVFVQPAMSVKAASEGLLDRIRLKAERDAKSRATYRWYEREFQLGLVPGALDPHLSVLSLTLTHIETYCNFWCDLKRRAADSTRNRFGWRSAWNRLDALANLLRDLKGRVEGYKYPERADAVFAEMKDTVAGSQAPIQEYDPAVLKAILAAGGDRVRLAVYCALNFGQYQSDIGQQIRRRHDEEHGGIIEIEGAQYLQWDRHKLKRRQRRMKRQNNEDKPVLLTHFVWPETWKLLNAFAAPEDNPLNLWLLNSNGLPLWRQEDHHKRAVDNISTLYYRAVADAEVRLPFEQIRKFGATASEKLGSIEVQEMYRGERRQGSSRRYVLQDFTGKLTPFLQQWAEQLRGDGVLY